MATGTDAGLLDEARPQSVFKHSILDQYIIRFATMTARNLTPRRSVLVDGFAGRGRHDNGSAASAECMMLAAQKARNLTQIPIFLVEQKQKDFKVLDGVADEYRARGLQIETRHGDCGDYLGEIVKLARGSSLFLFLDPCGANLPWTLLAPVLSNKARGDWPRTEALLNFNADLTRRAGGQLHAGQVDTDGVRCLDTVCGGDWWRQVALDAFEACGRKDWESAAQNVAMEYARRLSRQAKMYCMIAPVSRRAHHQPVYHLIFLTHDVHGLWVMGDSLAVARQKWLRALEPDLQDGQGMLFSTIDDQIDQEQIDSAGIIRTNLVNLLADGSPKLVVEHTTAIFKDVYGLAKETTYNKVLRELIRADEVEFIVKGKKPHNSVIQKKK